MKSILSIYLLCFSVMFEPSENACPANSPLIMRFSANSVAQLCPAVTKNLQFTSLLYVSFFELLSSTQNTAPSIALPYACSGMDSIGQRGGKTTCERLADFSAGGLLHCAGLMGTLPR